MVQRVAIARALIHSPSILLLDEPFTGLDTDSAARVRAVLAEQVARGAAVLLVTHNPSEAWDLASHVAVLAQGRWVIQEARTGSLGAFQERLAEATHG
jgi:ABC-type multidrug transport system ATPase subunit